MKPSFLLTAALALGILARLGLFQIFESNPLLYRFISERVEISTPISSWKCFVEGMFLIDHGLSPYNANDIFHGSPILLHLFKRIMGAGLNIDIFFILVDVVTAISLYFIAMSSQERYFLIFPNVRSNKNNGIDSKWLRSPYFAFSVFAFYYLNPFVILVTCCKCAANLSHCLMAVSIACSVYGQITVSAVALSVATVIDVYPILLLPINIATILSLAKVEPKRGYKKYSSTALCITLYTATFSVVLVYLFAVNLRCNHGDWNFIDQFYLFLFNGQEITPNIGAWWYLKMSLFNRFQSFFTIVLNLQPLVFVLPFLWRFGEYTFFCYYLVIYLFQLFRVYPCLSDTIFGITFLFISAFIQYKHFKHALVLIIVYFIGLQLMFFMWYMWIAAGTGNANFYYAGNLLYISANLYTLCTSIASARRQLDDYKKEQTTEEKEKQN